MISHDADQPCHCYACCRERTLVKMRALVAENERCARIAEEWLATTLKRMDYTVPDSAGNPMPAYQGTYEEREMSRIAATEIAAKIREGE